MITDGYISRERLLRDLEDDFNGGPWGSTKGGLDYHDGVRDEYDDVLNVIRQIPSADVCPSEAVNNLKALLNECANKFIFLTECAIESTSTRNDVIKLIDKIHDVLIN